MRGKQAASAANRRDRDALELRAITAERRTQQLQEELANARTVSAQRIASLTDLTKALAKERDKATAPALQEERERFEALSQRYQALYSEKLRNARHDKQMREGLMRELHRLRREIPGVDWDDLTTRLIVAISPMRAAVKVAAQSAARNDPDQP